MKYKLKAYPILEFGKRKDVNGNPHQEDSIYPPLATDPSGSTLFMVCDGMGGHEAGEVASLTVCDAISRSIQNDGHDMEGLFTNEDLSNALDEAYLALDDKDNGAEKKMGTTLTLLKLHDNGATIAHIGDSRVYHIRPGKFENDTQILFVTEDHSLVNRLVKAGEMTPEEARHSKKKNIITRAMQPGDSRCEADIALITDILPGDYFYLCSDGMLEQDEMEDGSALKRIFSNEIITPEEKVKILRGATANNTDNHSAYIIHILEIVQDNIIPNSPNNLSLENKQPKTDFHQVKTSKKTSYKSVIEKIFTFFKS